MANVTVPRSRFPDGAKVSLYPREERSAQGRVIRRNDDRWPQRTGPRKKRTQPPSKAIATAVVKPGSGEYAYPGVASPLTFTNVPAGRYFAAADVDDRWVIVEVTATAS